MGIFPENTNSKKYMHPNVHSSTIYNSQDMVATLMPINRWMDKIAICICNFMAALQYTCLKNSMDKRRLVGDSPWSRKGSDTTEHTHTASNTTVTPSTRKTKSRPLRTLIWNWWQPRKWRQREDAEGLRTVVHRSEWEMKWMHAKVACTRWQLVSSSVSSPIQSLPPDAVFPATVLLPSLLTHPSWHLFAS